MPFPDTTPVGTSSIPTGPHHPERRTASGVPTSRTREETPDFPARRAKQAHALPVEPLRYHTGEPVRIGDRVEAIAFQPGTVVHIVGCPRPMPGFANTAWLDLKAGFLVREDDGVLMHYVKAPATLHLVSRSTDLFADAGTSDAADG